MTTFATIGSTNVYAGASRKIANTVKPRWAPFFNRPFAREQLFRETMLPVRGTVITGGRHYLRQLLSLPLLMRCAVSCGAGADQITSFQFSGSLGAANAMLARVVINSPQPFFGDILNDGIANFGVVTDERGTFDAFVLPLSQGDGSIDAGSRQGQFSIIGLLLKYTNQTFQHQATQVQTMTVSTGFNVIRNYAARLIQLLDARVASLDARKLLSQYTLPSVVDPIDSEISKEYDITKAVMDWSVGVGVIPRRGQPTPDIAVRRVPELDKWSWLVGALIGVHFRTSDATPELAAIGPSNGLLTNTPATLGQFCDRGFTLVLADVTDNVQPQARLQISWTRRVGGFNVPDTSGAQDLQVAEALEILCAPYMNGAMLVVLPPAKTFADAAGGFCSQTSTLNGNNATITSVGRPSSFIAQRLPSSLLAALTMR